MGLRDLEGGPTSRLRILKGHLWTLGGLRLSRGGLRPNLSHGGVHFPPSEGGLYRFESPQTFSACRAFTLGGARDGCLSDPKNITTKLHVNWGHAAATELKRLLVDSNRDDARRVNEAEDVLEHFKVRRASEKAPHVPIAGTSTFSTFKEKLKVG